MGGIRPRTREVAGAALMYFVVSSCLWTCCFAVCLLRIVQRTQKLLPPLSRLIQPPISITNAALNLLSNAAYVLTAAATTAQW